MNQKPASELRFDLVSKDWVVIATGRARRPETFFQQKREKFEEPKERCPFCQTKNQERPLLTYQDQKWKLVFNGCAKQISGFFQRRKFKRKS